jgi:hypothetical protein
VKLTPVDGLERGDRHLDRARRLPRRDELVDHAGNAIARHSQRGWRIDKPGKEVHIDAIVALAMALDSAETQPEPVRFLGWL